MEEWLTPPALAAIGALLATLATTIISIVKTMRDGPIDRRTAELATTTALTNASKVTVESAVVLNAKLHELQSKTQSELDDEQRYVRVWELWYDKLKRNWLTLRQEPYPPVAPERQSNDDVG